MAILGVLLGAILIVQDPAPLPPATTLERVIPPISDAERTQVLVLGTPHLSRVTGFEPSMLDQLLQKLAAFAPNVICVESLPARVIRTMLAARDEYGEVMAQVAPGVEQRAALALAALSATDSQARATRDALLKESKLAAPERVELVLALLSDYDTPSATLQWMRARGTNGFVAAAEQVPAELRDFLERRQTSTNEIYSLAVPLALKLGHSHIVSIDDHLDKDDYLRILPRLGEELAKSPEVAAVTKRPIFTESAELEKACVKSGDLWPLYRFLNSTDYGARDVDAQWNVFLRTRLPSGLDRGRLALWDVRNLNIASHIRRVNVRYPAGKVLVIIGAGHKPFLEAQLSLLLDVRVVAFTELEASK